MLIPRHCVHVLVMREHHHLHDSACQFLPGAAMKSRYALEMDTKSCGRGQLNPHARATRPTLKVPLRERKRKRIPLALSNMPASRK